MYTPEQEPGKGEGPLSPPLQLTKTAAQEDGGGEEDLQGEQRERRERDSWTLTTYMGCVLSSDWCGEGEVQPAPVVQSSSLKRRSPERSDSVRMRLTKVGMWTRCVCACV